MGRKHHVHPDGEVVQQDDAASKLKVCSLIYFIIQTLYKFFSFLATIFSRSSRVNDIGEDNFDIIPEKETISPLSKIKKAPNDYESNDQKEETRSKILKQATKEYEVKKAVIGSKIKSSGPRVLNPYLLLVSRRKFSHQKKTSHSRCSIFVGKLRRPKFARQNTMQVLLVARKHNVGAFEKLVSNKFGERTAHKFAAKSHLPEVTNFLCAVLLFKKAVNNSKKTAREQFGLFEEIISNFIQHGSPQEINISDQERKNILQFKPEFLSCDDVQLQLSVFDEAYAETETLFWTNIRARQFTTQNSSSKRVLATSTSKQLITCLTTQC